AGVLFRNAEAIETMRKIDTLVVDKTGTLTQGKPTLVSVTPAKGFDESELPRLAASLERASEHPLAAAIVAGAQARGVEQVKVESFHSITGKGVRGRLAGREVALGNLACLDELSVEAGDLSEQAEAMRVEGETVMYVVIDKRAAGLIEIADPITASNPEALQALHGDGIRLVMLTGDSATTAKAVAGKLGIEDVVAEV